MTGIFWASTWRCADCGHAQPIEPGENTRPIQEAHECDSVKLATHQASLAGWVEGYRFALEHLDDDMVQADKRDGSGWIRFIGAGAIEISAEEVEQVGGDGV